MNKQDYQTKIKEIEALKRNAASSPQTPVPDKTKNIHANQFDTSPVRSNRDYEITVGGLKAKFTSLEDTENGKESPSLVVQKLKQEKRER